jgi:hypothetical protein
MTSVDSNNAAAALVELEATGIFTLCAPNPGGLPFCFEVTVVSLG